MKLTGRHQYIHGAASRALSSVFISSSRLSTPFTSTKENKVGVKNTHTKRKKTHPNVLGARPAAPASAVLGHRTSRRADSPPQAGRPPQEAVREATRRPQGRPEVARPLGTEPAASAARPEAPTHSSEPTQGHLHPHGFRKGRPSPGYPRPTSPARGGSGPARFTVQTRPTLP